jgi:pimeloyl-ACP methyl ester carboxylesterase
MELQQLVRDGVRLRLVHEGEPRRWAVVLPGAAYTPDGALFWFSRKALVVRGLGVVEVWWDAAGAEAARAGLAVADERGGGALVLAKSIGTTVLAELQLELPAVWLTPLLAREPVLEALRNPPAPALVVVGTADPASPPERVAELSGVELLELEGADHSLEVPDALASLELLRRSTGAIDAFAGRWLPG